MKFLKSHWSNIFFLAIIILLIIPQTRKPLQVGVTRLFAFSPSLVSKEEREVVTSYNWPLQDLEGEKYNLREAEGEVALVNIWATWCPPCIAEMPSFEDLYITYGDSVKFYFISYEEKERLQTFLEKKNYELPVFQPLSHAPQSLETSSLPTTYLISRNGEIVMKKTGAADWSSQIVRQTIDDLLKEEAR